MRQTLPLTQAQSRIWYAQKKAGDMRPFQIGGEVLIQGEIVLERLYSAIRWLVRENDALRLQFCEQGGQARQYIAGVQTTAVDVIDFSTVPHPEEQYKAWAGKQLQRPFVLIDAPMYAFTVFRLSAERAGYFLRLHHLIVDGWSVQLITQRVSEAYEALSQGKSPCGHKPSYTEYLHTEHQLLQTDVMERHRNFWVERLTPAPPVPSEEKASDARRKSFALTPEQDKLLQRTAREWNLSIPALWLGLCCLNRYKRYGERETVVGFPLLGRTGRWEREIIGTFTNTMPIRLRVDRSLGIKAFLEQVAFELEECLRHQKAPYNQVLQRLQAGNPNIGALYDICVNCYNNVPAASIGGQKTRNTEYFSNRQVYALQIVLRRWNDDAFQVDYDYRLDRYSGREIHAMHRQLLWFFEQAAAQPEHPVGTLCLMRPAEAERAVHTFNQTASPFPAHETVLDALERTVSRYPEHIAVSLENEVWSYRELWRRTGLLAAWFRQSGVEPGMTVAVLATHALETVAAMLAAFWLGAVLQPLDPCDPPGRIEELLALSGARRLVSPSRRKSCIPVLALDELTPMHPAQTPRQPVASENAAYLIATSGSTGRPKGVLVSHRNLMNYLFWARGQYLCHEREVFALYSSFAFDFTLTSLFLPLLDGHEIRLYPHERERNVFRTIFSENRATILKVTPSHFPLLHDVLPAPDSLHTLIVGGENLPGHRCAALAGALGDRVRIFNEYGPTEATIGCMIHRYRARDGQRDFVPLGRPIANARVYLLDEEGVPVPDGAVGELVVGGECVALGYRGAQDGERAFRQDPFVPGRVYDTGDFARRESDGEIIMLGRRDEEWKLRGHRVNFMEIERCIERSGLVKAARVTVRQSNRGARILCAYLAGGDDTAAQRVTEYCAAHLPGYLVPQCCIPVESIPLTVNGKTDWDRLPLPDETPCGEKPSADAANSALLLSVLNAVLGEQAAEGDNFYARGGDSIKAIQISSRLAEQGLVLSVGDILRHPMIGDMARYITRKPLSDTPLEPDSFQGFLPSTPAVRWFLAQKLADPGQYNQSMLLHLKRPVPTEWLREALGELIRHHDVLRINLDRTGRLYYNETHRSALPPVEERTLARLEEIRRIGHRFDLEKELLVKPRVLHLGREDYFFLTLHHLVTDGVSWRILLDDLALLLSQRERGESFRLPEKSDSYQRFAECLSREGNQTEFSVASGGYWMSGARTVCCAIPHELTDRLIKRQRSCGKRMEDILLYALYRALTRLGLGQEIWVELEGHGRGQAASCHVERTVGWFTELRLLRLFTPEGARRGAWPEMQEITDLEGAHTAARRIRFNYLGELGTRQNSFFEALPSVWPGDIGGRNRVFCRVCVDVLLSQGRLKMYFTFEGEDALCAGLPAAYLKALEEAARLAAQNET